MSVSQYLKEYAISRVQHERVPMFIEVSGKGVFDGEVLRAIKTHKFEYKDVFGDEQENASIEVTGKGQVKGDKDSKGTILALRIPLNSENVIIKELNSCLKQFKLGAKKLSTIKDVSFVQVK